MPDQLKICVIGAGVVGLHVAVRLQRDFPLARVTVIAAGQVHQTTSIGAAGLFQPGASFQTTLPQTRREIVDESWRYYREVLASDQAAAAGVFELSGYYFSRHGPHHARNVDLERLCADYRTVTERELNCPGGWTAGVFCTTLLADGNYHLNWLTQRFKEAGGDIIPCAVRSLDDVTGFDIVVNCTGIGARQLTGDRRLVPIRGQVFQVRAPWIKTFFFGEDETYIIPGVDHVTLGGSRTFSGGTAVDERESSAIWERCLKMVPSLKWAEVIREWVGLRPHRDPVRIEKEPRVTGVIVIHCYGHGSCGVMFAPGSAAQVSRLVTEVTRGDLTNPVVSGL